MKKILIAVGALFLFASVSLASVATDVSNLDDLARAITSQSNSANMNRIKAYAVAQAAATQSQEQAIQDLEARVAALEGTTPEPPPPPPSSDTEAPAQPVLSLGPATQTSLVLNWQAGNDNVGVDHYNVWLGSQKVTETSGLSYTFTELSCGTTYLLGLEVVDAAGNKSLLSEAQWSTSTSPCDNPPPPPPAGGDLFVSTSGSDASACTQAVPCRTLNRAYQVAQCGSVIEVAGGAYPNQQVNEVSALSSCSEDVVFQAAAGATVTIPHLNVGSCCGFSGTATDAPDHVVFRGFVMPDGFAMDGDANYVTFDRIDGGSFFIGGGTNIMVSNSDFGPCWSSGSGPTCDSFFRQIVITGGSRTNGVTLEGNTIHDFILNPNSSDHFECIRLDGVTNLTYRGNRFYNCEIYGTTSTGTAGTWLIENNWFQSSCFGYPPNCPRGSAIVNIGDVPGTLIIRFNSFGPGEAIADEGAPTGGASHRFVIGNIFGSSQDCLTNQATYQYNVFYGTGGATCGSNATYIGPSAPYMNSSWGSSGDYHLSATTAAENYVPSSVANSDSSTDYDGQSRGEMRDAGSDER